MKNITFPQILIIGACLLIFMACSRKTSSTAVSDPPVIDTQENKIAEKQKMIEEDGSVDLEDEGGVPLRSTRKPDTVISMETTACYGKCPVYIATIMSDGSLYYFGRKFVSNVGYYQSKVPYKEIRNIDRKMQSINIMDKAERYPEDGEDILDVSNTILHIEFKGQKKKIRINHASPIELNEFVTYLENFFKKVDWQPASPKD